MFKNYLKIAYRNLIKQKAYSFINIFGLALGLSTCILVGLYIYQEFQYDNYHQNKDRVFRISTETTFPGGTSYNAETPALLAPTLKLNYPEIDEITRVYFPYKNLIAAADKKFYERNLIFADDGFFDIFSFSFLQGNAESALKEKNSIVISQSVARKYFGSQNPVGNVLNLDNRLELLVTGVIKDIPINSHFTFEMVATYSSLVDLPEGNYLDQWGATFGSYTYVLLQPGTDPQNFADKITPPINKTMKLLKGVKNRFILQPLTAIHLFSKMENEIEPGSSMTHIIILSSISLFILLLACINFVNLTTARAVKRAREIGVRKTFGASRQQLIRQFLGESIIISILALGVAFVLVELMQPVFTRLIGSGLIYHSFYNLNFFAVIFLATVVIGFLAGLYPAFVLTNFKPLQVLKSSPVLGKTNSAILRKGLVLVQYSISIILIIFTFLINQQIRFLRNYDMGFEREQIVILKVPERLNSKTETIKSEFNAITGVIESTASLGVPVVGSGFQTNFIPDLEHEDEAFMVSIKMIDVNYLNFYNIPLVAGRMLTEADEANFSEVTLVNEATVKKLGFASNEEALGKSYTIGLSDGKKRFSPQIVGVVKDFHFNSLHEEVSPLLFMNWPYLFKEISLKISPQNVPATIKEIEKVWKKFYPSHPFDFSFLDESIEAMYRAEERSFRLISTSSVLAILLACLGLLGLTSFTTEQRRKEIGVRKVLGASISNIINCLSLEFIKLIVISNLIAWPLSYYIIDKWLASFPYRVEMDMTNFLLGSLVTLTISLLTIGYIVFRSAAANPIESLRYE